MEDLEDYTNHSRREARFPSEGAPHGHGSPAAPPHCQHSTGEHIGRMRACSR